MDIKLHTYSLQNNREKTAWHATHTWFNQVDHGMFTGTPQASQKYVPVSLFTKQQSPSSHLCSNGPEQTGPCSEVTHSPHRPQDTPLQGSMGLHLYLSTHFPTSLLDTEHFFPTRATALLSSSHLQHSDFLHFFGHSFLKSKPTMWRPAAPSGKLERSMDCSSSINALQAVAARSTVTMMALLASSIVCIYRQLESGRKGFYQRAEEVNGVSAEQAA